MKFDHKVFEYLNIQKILNFPYNRGQDIRACLRQNSRYENCGFHFPENKSK